MLNQEKDRFFEIIEKQREAIDRQLDELMQAHRSSVHFRWVSFCFVAVVLGFAIYDYFVGSHAVVSIVSGLVLSGVLVSLFIVLSRFLKKFLSTANKIKLDYNSNVAYFKQCRILLNDQIVRGEYALKEKIEMEKKLILANLAILNQKKALDSVALVVETDRYGRIKYVNDKFVEISKYSREELLGKTHKVVNSGYHPKSFFADQWRTISQGRIWHGEIKNRAKDGSFYWVDTTIYPVLGEGGKPVSYIAVRFDVTEKKEALERLQAADRAKSEFLYTMSHEIRTPLNAIIGMSNLLMETQLSPEQLEYTDALLNSGRNLLTIINDILDFSKIESGKLDLEIIEFNLEDYFRDILKTYHYTARKKGIEFNVRLNNYSSLVYGDEGRIGQVVLNLVSNAIKFTKSGAVTVSCEMTPQGDRTLLRVSVSDTGIGIPDEAKKRMFQAFAQAEKSTSRKYGGTGLGLSISKRLLDAMGGQIGFTSKYGTGTTFHFELLLRTGAKIKCVEGSQSVSNKVTYPESREMHGRILVAEDNQTNQIVIGRMLDTFGLKYHFVANGNEVLEALREASYDLILMDCQMPEMDGYDATRIIRQSESLPNNIPIIALTANVVQSDEQKCFDAGMNAYLCKPIEKLELERTIRGFLVKKGEVWIDQSILKQFDDLQMEGAPDIMVETIESFLKTSPVRVEKIQEYVYHSNLDAAAREAHALKSSARTLGAMTLGQICQDLENVPKEDKPSVAQELVKLLNQAYLGSSNELGQIKRSREANSEVGLKVAA